jgi:hypothetical protein
MLASAPSTSTLSLSQIEEDVAEVDVLIAEAARVQLMEAGRDVEADRGARGERQVDPARRRGDEVAAADEAPRAQRHHVAETGVAGHFDEIERPQEGLRRRTARDRAGKALAQGHVRLDACGMVEFERQRHAVDQDLVDLALPARAEQVGDGAAAFTGRDEALPRLQRACRCPRGTRRSAPQPSQHPSPSLQPRRRRNKRKRVRWRAFFLIPSRRYSRLPS